MTLGKDPMPMGCMTTNRKVVKEKELSWLKTMDLFVGTKMTIVSSLQKNHRKMLNFNQ